MTAITAAAPTSGAAAPPTALAWGVVYRTDVAPDGRITGSIARPVRIGCPARLERWHSIHDIHTLRREGPVCGLDPDGWLLAWHDGDRWHATTNIPTATEDPC
ncbi:hypothetical protein OG948_21400 [Embleya sp. NBC_00888]|uniref:hypothetical protein n=1 Tax=Embleya sp. NBC_00888 TaxID=2975960 RepID=UPI00386B3EB3|nr:hypothetical protein OG948_21400 [Embleya sp. NBC_00888]